MVFDRNGDVLPNGVADQPSAHLVDVRNGNHLHSQYFVLPLEDRDVVAVIDVTMLRVAKLVRGVPCHPWAMFNRSGLSFCH